MLRGSSNGRTPADQAGGGGSTPTPALQCHQYAIRLKEAARDPREVLPDAWLGSLLRVVPVSTKQAREVILRYEWLRTMQTNAFVHFGLATPWGEVIGVASFGPPYGWRTGFPGGYHTAVLGRGACVHWAPKSAASYLIRNACRLAGRLGVEIVSAYADVDAGEIGTVYQAANWLYLGQGTSHGPTRVEWQMPGSDRWMSSRMLEHKGYSGRGAWAAARARGWKSRTRPAKHLYAWAEGRRRREILALLAPRALPYPKRPVVG